MQRFALIVATVTTSLFACTMPNLPFLSGKSSSKSSESRTVATSETHTVNGHPVDQNGNREDQDDDRPAHAKASRRPARSGADFGATCQHNDDCESNTCYVGYGDVGYCTKICTSFSDCKFGWECTHEGVGNAPQKICQQEKD